MNINFEYYKIFYVIAKNKNITKAARELRISQPAISRMLKTMEEQLNTKLFIRKTKGVMLTKEGNELYQLISSQIDGIMKAEKDFAKILNHQSWKISIDKSYFNYLIKKRKLDFLFQNDIYFTQNNDFQILNKQLTNNLIDFAFISEPAHDQFHPSLHFKKIQRLHFVLMTNKKSDNQSDLPLVIYHHPKFKNIYENYFSGTISKKRHIIEVDDYENILPLIQEGYANGVLIQEFLSPQIRKNNNYSFTLLPDTYSVNIGILYNMNNELKLNEIFKLFYS